MSVLWRLALVAPLFESFVLSRVSHFGFVTCITALLPLHILLLISWRTFVWPFVFSPLRKLPEPEGGSWVHGHRHLVPDSRSGSPQDEWINQVPNEGLIRYRQSYNTELLMVTSSKALAEVLVHKSYDFAKPKTLRLGLGRILGVGLIVAEGNEHKLQRRQLLPAFAHRHVKNLYPVFWAKAAELVDKLTVVVKNGSEGGKRPSKVIDIPNWIARATIDIIGVAGMGEDFSAIQQPDNEVSSAYASVFEPSALKSKLAMLKMVVEGLVARVVPIKRSDNIARASEALKKVARRLIRQKQEIKAETGKLEAKDIISVALNSGVFTEENLANQILTFLAAGHETTATTIAWAVIALTQYPAVQQRLREELKENLPPLQNLATATAAPDVLDNLPYLHAVCNEVLRMYPPAGLTKRTATKDTSILGHPVPKGTDVVICIRAINHSQEHWGKDALEFRPERWLGVGNWNSGGAVDNYALMTFLHGPRSCIGQGFAKAEFGILLAVLVASFEIELEDLTAPIEWETGLTTRPKQLHVRLTLL